MNNLNYQNSIHELTKLLCQLGNYIFQVNSIVTQMNNVISQLNNPMINQINNNYNPLFNNNFINNANNNYNQFINPQNDIVFKNPINVTFTFEDTIYHGHHVNLILKNDMSIKEMMQLLYGKLDKNISDYISKGDIYFKYNSIKLDIYSEKKISELFGINIFNWNENQNCNFRISAYQIKMFIQNPI